MSNHRVASLLSNSRPWPTKNCGTCRACGDAAVGEQLRARDPSGRGLPSAVAVRLLRALLSWNPGARPTAEQARSAVLALELKV